MRPNKPPDLGSALHVTARAGTTSTAMSEVRKPRVELALIKAKLSAEEQRIASDERVALAVANMSWGLEHKRLDYARERDWWALLLGFGLVVVGATLFLTGHTMAGAIVFGSAGVRAFKRGA